MTRRWARALVAVAAVSLAACESDSVTKNGPAGQGSFLRYAAIGTSISMGVASGDNAVVYANQVYAWPALLARQAGITNFSQPLMKVPGCFPPLVAPLALNRNLRGVAGSPTDTTCAGLLAGVSNPASGFIFNDLAISGATTNYALNKTPDIAVTEGLGSSASNTSAVFRRKAYPLILPPGKSQVTAAMALNPTFVSVELGANEVLGTVGGVVAPGITFTPTDVWQADYDKLVDSIAKTGAKALLVTVPNVSGIVSMRSGADLYADSAEFKAAYRVTVSSNCKDSPNLIFTAVKIPTLVATAAAGVPNVTLSCADAPGTADYLLTPTDVQNVTALVTAMNAHINDLASQHGWAVLDINSLLATTVAERPAAYSVVRQMTCTLPYGVYIGLDGVHPLAAGHVKLANAAIAAIDAKYGFSIPQIAEGTNPNPCP